MGEDSWQEIRWNCKLQEEGKQGNALKIIELLCPENGGNRFLQIAGKRIKLSSFIFIKILILMPQWESETSQS
jgi:hypothetical protein